MNIREQRKWEHIEKTIEAGLNDADYFKDIVLIPDASAALSLDDIDTQCTIFNKKIAAPLIINAMTGGAKGLEAYNRDFAFAARENKIAMAVGSQKAGLLNRELEETYKIARKVNPEGVLFANLSALESIESMKRAVSMIEADALQLHINHSQELSMHEGDRDFSELLRNIEKAVTYLEVPVIVKEVGSGISKKAAQNFADLGVKHFDISGFGGTNFAAIEERRTGSKEKILSDTGIPTPVSILEVKAVRPAGYLIASGGIKSAKDIITSLVLGADFAAMAGALLLHYHKNGAGALTEKINELVFDMRKICLILGVKTINDLSQSEYILKNEVREWIHQRL